jgi:hypothetical protein
MVTPESRIIDERGRQGTDTVVTGVRVLRDILATTPGSGSEWMFPATCALMFIISIESPSGHAAAHILVDVLGDCFNRSNVLGCASTRRPDHPKQRSSRND